MDSEYNPIPELTKLYTEWGACTSCQLGVRRAATNGNFIPGKGAIGGILFLGDGPGLEEETDGVPFAGNASDLIKAILDKHNFKHYCLTNLVKCRSCIHATDASGTLLFRNQGKVQVPVLRDVPPPPECVTACLDNLYKEIYLIDPLVIVTFGVAAAETLLKKPVPLTKARGNLTTCLIPGRTYQAVVTKKTRTWARKTKEGTQRPVEQTQVTYSVLPTFHPSYVMRKISDHGADSPWNLFAQDIGHAIQIYNFLTKTESIEPEEVELP